MSVASDRASSKELNKQEQAKGNSSSAPEASKITADDPHKVEKLSKLGGTDAAEGEE